MTYERRLDKLGQDFAELKRMVRQLMTHAPLGHSSVSEGALRILSDEGLIVGEPGSESGSARVYGLVFVDGLVDIVGNLRVLGDGTITAGNVVIEGDLIRVGDDIEIDAATNQIRVADMLIDPSDGGQVTFPGGATVSGGSTGGVELRQGDYSAIVTSGGVSVGREGRAVSVTEAGIQMLGAPTGNPGPEYPAGVYYRDPFGFVSVASGAE
ncbi:hypothetical protein [Microbacterium dauci]|uniref:DUF342 domain-containing protein n=1 Tax=Microbacterium dauci TaxID=3048008 RepID=A0ABT6ZCA9_9MICO|nr:hypothetical protein [Microbacterium sp. LX3-4]MDJ1113796.1 hypothetical protein [Microbacterium sp. LX3-4]